MKISLQFILPVCVLLLRSLSVADPAEDFRKRLKTAEFVMIAVYPHRSHEFPNVLATFGKPGKSDFEWLKNMEMEVALDVDPGQAVLYVRSSPGLPQGTEFTQPLSGKTFEMAANSKEKGISIPFGDLPDFIRSFQNPLLKESSVKKGWVKSVPELVAPATTEEMRKRVDEWLKRRNEEQAEARGHEPFFR